MSTVAPLSITPNPNPLIDVDAAIRQREGPICRHDVRDLKSAVERRSKSDEVAVPHAAAWNDRDGLQSEPRFKDCRRAAEQEETVVEPDCRVVGDLTSVSFS